MLTRSWTNILKGANFEKVLPWKLIQFRHRWPGLIEWNLWNANVQDMYTLNNAVISFYIEKEHLHTDYDFIANIYLIQYSSFSFCGPNVRRHQILTYPEQNQSVASIHCPQLKPYRTLKRFCERNYHVNHAWISNNWLFSSNCNLPSSHI